MKKHLFKAHCPHSKSHSFQHSRLYNYNNNNNNNSSNSSAENNHNNTQSLKVSSKRGQHTSEDNSPVCDIASSIRDQLNDDQYSQLVTIYGHELTEEAIRQLTLWLGANPCRQKTVLKKNILYYLQGWPMDAARKKLGTAPLGHRPSHPGDAWGDDTL